MNTINILIANDHILLREGISSVIVKHSPHFNIMGEAENFNEVLNMLSHKKADILMIDDIMPFGCILDVLPIINRQYPTLKIIINSMCENTALHVKKSIDYADGWIGYNSNGHEFIKAIETVYAGGNYFINGFEKEI